MAGYLLKRVIQSSHSEGNMPNITSSFQLIRTIACQSWEPSFGLLFDIDGVIVRGKQVIPTVPDSFKKLLDREGNFRIPTVFVTNAGNGLTHDKAKQLSDWLNIKVSEEHVVMAHSPLKVFNRFHDKNVLVSGQGPIEEIARKIGFKKIVTIDDLRKAYPLLDAVDHKRRVSKGEVGTSDGRGVGRVEAVVLLSEPVRWETSLQLVLDVLMTGGAPGQPPPPAHHCYPHLPVLACNMDLQWMAEASMPRFGHGAFLLCLENLYKKITGKDLIYEALVGKPSEITYRYAQQMILDQANKNKLSNKITRLYAIGDNINTDIFGANLYNELLSSGESYLPTDAHMVTNAQSSVRQCCSILVKTGVYSHELSDSELDHAPRDFVNLVGKSGSAQRHRTPQHTVQDVCQAIDLIFKLEGITNP